MTDERREGLFERAKVAALVALAEHGSTTDIQEALIGGDGRGTLAPGALDKMVGAVLREARDAMLTPEPPAEA